MQDVSRHQNDVQVIHKVECRSCFQEIDERAVRCQYCGAQQRTGRSHWPLLAAAALVIVVVFAVLAYGLRTQRDDWRLQAEQLLSALEAAAAETGRLEALAQSPGTSVAAPSDEETETAAPRAARGDVVFESETDPPAAELSLTLAGLPSAKLQAAWELLLHCDSIDERACAAAQEAFQLHMREDIYLQCMGHPDGQAQLCWLSVDP